MVYYTASIKQSVESVRKYSLVVFSVFYSKVMITEYVLSILLVLTGSFAVKKEGLSILLILLGCILFMNVDAPAKYLANRVIDFFKGTFPILHYCFHDDYLLISEKMTKIKYTDFIKLVEDDDFFYLFQTKQYGIMIKKTSISGNANNISFQDFISQKSDLTWGKPPTILSFNLKNIVQVFIKQDKYKGPRL